MASTQYTLQANKRTERGKGPAGRLRRTGRIPAVLYGAGVEATSIDVDARELYHALHTQVGHNVLINLSVEGDSHLTIVRDWQTHAVRGDVLHLDFQAVRRDQIIGADIPVHLLNEEDPHNAGGIVQLVLHSVPILVTPLEVPNQFTLDLTGMGIGDVRRVSDIAAQLPEGAQFDIDEDTTVVTINAPISEEELEADLEGEEGEELEGDEVDAGDADVDAEDGDGQDADTNDDE